MRVASKFGLAAAAALCLLAAIPALPAIADTVAPATTVTVAPAADVAPWTDVLEQVKEAGIAFVIAALGALASVVTWYSQKYLGATASQVVTALYHDGIDRTAGWLATFLKANPDLAAVPLTEDHPAVQAAAQQFTASYPAAVAAVQPAAGEVENDLLAAVAKLIPGPVGTIVQAAEPIVAGVVKAVTGKKK